MGLPAQLLSHLPTVATTDQERGWLGLYEERQPTCGSHAQDLSVLCQGSKGVQPMAASEVMAPTHTGDTVRLERWPASYQCT